MDVGKLLVAAGTFLTGLTALQEASKPKRRVVPSGGSSGRVDGTTHGVPNNLKSTEKRVRNIQERVKWIVHMIQKSRADPVIRAIAVREVSRKCNGRWCVSERDYEGEVKAIFDWTRKNVRYIRDRIDADQFHHARRTIQFGGGDCDDASIVLASLLQAIGYPVKLRVIQTSTGPDWDHIYVLAGVPPGNPTKLISLDASVDKPAGWKPPQYMIRRVKDFDVP